LSVQYVRITIGGRMSEFRESSRRYFEVLAEEGLSDEGVIAVAALKRVIFQQNEIIREKDRLIEEANNRALTDALTGLGNRGAFDYDLETTARDLASMNSHREIEPYEQFSRVLILGDLDFFKLVNDVLGYEYGDATLVSIANLLKLSMRHDDRVYRLGGDEFAALILVRKGMEMDAFRAITKKFYDHLNMLRDEDVLSPELEALRAIDASFAYGVFPETVSSVDDLTDIVNQTMRRMKSIKEAKGVGMR